MVLLFLISPCKIIAIHSTDNGYSNIITTVDDSIVIDVTTNSTSTTTDSDTTHAVRPGESLQLIAAVSATAFLVLLLVLVPIMGTVIIAVFFVRGKKKSSIDVIKNKEINGYPNTSSLSTEVDENVSSR